MELPKIQTKSRLKIKLMKLITKAIKTFAVLILILSAKTNSAQCSANFVYNTGVGGSVTFTSTSITLTTATVYYWTYGNGSPTFSATGSAGMYPSTTYTANGTYTVTLFIYSAIPTCSSSISAVVTITNSAGCGLNANFSSTQGSNGLVNFNNTSTATLSGTTYTWMYGDGGTSNAVSPAHTYSANGSYSVTLLANNNTSTTCTDSTTIIINVNSYCALTAGFSFSYLSNGSVAFFNTTTPSVTTTYTWNFINNNPSTSNLTNPIATYSANGTYTVTLFAHSSTPNCNSNTTAVITITNATGCNLVANFSANQGTNGAVSFNNTSTGTNSTTTYNWSFGNAQTSTLSSPSTTYNANGLYQVTLVATNNSTPACTSTKTLQIYVSSICNLNPTFTYTATPSGNVFFTNTTSGSNSLLPVSWNFGHSSVGNPATSTLSAPSHQYPSGTYTVSLTVFSSSTCIITTTQTITVNTYSCNLNAAFNHTIGSSGLVTFASAATGTNSNTAYFWNFGDGYTSNAMNPVHTYTNGGTHYVTFAIYDSTYTPCRDSVIQALNITGIPCIANSNFTLVPTLIPQYWNAIPSYPYNVTAAQWSWGDGSYSNSLYTAPHQYSAAANYTICLTVTVSCGSTSSACANYYVSKPSGDNSSSGMIYVNVVEPEKQLQTGIINPDSEERKMSIYPNPNEGSFVIQFNKGIEAGTEIRIYSLIGSLIYSEKTTHIGETSVNIELPSIEKGIYFIEIKDSTKSISQKMILK